jgi:hypothetical protein
MYAVLGQFRKESLNSEAALRMTITQILQHHHFNVTKMKRTQILSANIFLIGWLILFDKFRDC